MRRLAPTGLRRCSSGSSYSQRCPRRATRAVTRYPRPRGSGVLTAQRNPRPAQYIARVEKKGKAVVAPSGLKGFSEDGYYIWVYEGSKVFSHIMTGVLVVVFLFFTCFSIWPMFLKTDREWDLSQTLRLTRI